MALSFLLVQPAEHCYRTRMRKGDILCSKDISKNTTLRFLAKEKIYCEIVKKV